MGRYDELALPFAAFCQYTRDIIIFLESTSSGQTVDSSQQLLKGRGLDMASLHHRLLLVVRDCCTLPLMHGDFYTCCNWGDMSSGSHLYVHLACDRECSDRSRCLNQEKLDALVFGPVLLDSGVLSPDGTVRDCSGKSMQALELLTCRKRSIYLFELFILATPRPVMVQYFDYTLIDFAHHLVVDGEVVSLPNLLGHSVKLEYKKWLVTALGYNNLMSFAVLE